MKLLERIARLLLCTILIACAGPLAQAQTYPNRPIHLVLPYAPGGIIDYIGRVLAQKLGDTIGQTVVSENRPGAGGIVGTDTVARAAPDGYTIVIMDPAIVTNPTLQSDVPYDLFKNLQTVSIVGSASLVLIVSPQLGVKTFQELVAYGKANPGKLNFASAGVGTTGHLSGELFKVGTGIDATHIPYKGIGGSYTDLMSGKVQMAFSSIAGALPFTQDNRVVPLATTGRTRSPAFPNLPTVAEAGVPGFDVDIWLGIFAPAGLPPDVMAKLNGAINTALKNPDLKAAFAKVGNDATGTSPEEGAKFVKAEYERWKKVIVDAKIKQP
jgi:tripartite-type tricarboxylate transporter receptor subunit TctC